MKKEKPAHNDFIRYSGLGLQLMVTIGIFILIGYYLDRRFDTSPVWVLIFSFIGTGAGFYHFVKSLPKT
jgi:F0F1-type ATP synthase assembly protein I